MINTWTESLTHWIPALTLLAVLSAVLAGLHWWLLARRGELGSEARLPRQLLLAGITLVGALLVVLALPISDALRGQILSLLGVMLTAVIGLSSTTFVANAMAGIMLRVVGQFRPGDFIRLNDKFGRVTERGLFHVEIQTEDRDLTTFPNLLLITHPLTVVHHSGTIVSAQVSLGYDIPRTTIETALCTAAEQAGLTDPFVQVVSLQDFSVLYRVAGSLTEVKHLLTVRSNLRKAVMDVLHGEGLEIASPTLMNQRRLPDEQRIAPPAIRVTDEHAPTVDPNAPEAKVFDRAEMAEAVAQARQTVERLQSEDANDEALTRARDELATLESQLTDAKNGNAAS